MDAQDEPTLLDRRIKAAGPFPWWSMIIAAIGAVIFVVSSGVSHFLGAILAILRP